MKTERSFPTHSGKRFTPFDPAVFWQTLCDCDKESGSLEQLIAAALLAASGGVDTDGEPVKFWVQFQASSSQEKRGINNL